MDAIAKLIGYALLILIAIAFFGKLRENGALDPKAAVFMDEEGYVAAEDVSIYHISITKTSQIRMVLDVKNDAPLDVMTTTGKISKAQFTTALGVKLVADVVSIFSSDGDKQIDFFDNPMSRQGVYREFATPWVTFNPGNYTIIIDNTRAFTPPRGDAPIHLKLYERPVRQQKE